MVSLRGDRDRLPIRDLRRVRADLDAELFLHTLHDQTQMQLTHTAQHSLVRLGVELDREARILRSELMKRIRQFLLLAALLEVQGDAVHGRRHCYRAHAYFVLVVAGMEHVVEVDVLDLRHRADVSGNHRRDLLELFALRAIQVREPYAFALLADIHLGAGLDLALVHAKRDEPADVGVDIDLEGVADEMTLRVGRVDLEGLLAAVQRVELGRIRFERAGHELREHAQELAQSGAGLGRDEANGNQVSPPQRALERIVELLQRDVLALL